ncbi:MAG: DUF4252 domain-containing protein [Candidatus Coprenecus sp.]
MMKKIITAFIAATAVLFATALTASTAYAKTEDLTSLFKKYDKLDKNDKVDYMEIKGLLLSLCKMGDIKVGECDAEAQFVKNMESIEFFEIDNENNYILFSNFCTDLEKILNTYAMVMETREGDEVIKMYVRELGNDSFKDLVIFTADEEIDVVSIRGDFPIASLNESLTHKFDK